MLHLFRYVSPALCVCLLTALEATPAHSQGSAPDRQIINTGPGLSLHKEMFMLPVTGSNLYHDARVETVFQISAKYRLFESHFYFAYTQISFWQAYDSHNSAPFRETNYNPEIFFRSARTPFHNGFVGFDLGFEHESNGQKPPVSRSWNLIYVSPYYAKSHVLLYLKLRYRIPEKDKEYPGAMEGDDNPDITDYLGYSDLHLYFDFWHHQMIHLMVRGNMSTGRGYVLLNYSMPVPWGETSFLNVRVSHGYGESLVDYKESLTRVGVGVMFCR
jgi:phospholipase A1